MTTATQQPEKLHFTWGDAFKNYSLVTSVLHSIARSPSNTEHEFEIKYNLLETMKAKGHSYGRGLQLTTLGGLIYFCMKSNMIKTKVFAGFMYTYWISHFYTLGSHLGLFMHTRWACEQLNMDPKYRTGQVTQELIRRIKIRNERRAAGEIVESESDFMREFYLVDSSEEIKESFGKNSYVENDYFAKNFSKYVKTGNSDDMTKVFNPDSGSYEEQLKIPYLDCFLTRYLYHNAARWGRRFSMAVGLRD